MTPDIVLTLGDFTFGRFEVPAHISAGGEQKLVIHKLPGQDPVVDQMGWEHKDLEWEGLLYGPDAENRARFLDGLRVRGVQQLLTWSKFRYQVVVKGFEFRFERRWQIPYRICCFVLTDETGVLTTLPDPLVITRALGADMDSASALGALIGDGPLSSVLSTLGDAIKAVSNFATAAQDTIKAVLTPLAAAQQAVQTLIAGVGNTVLNVTTLGGILPNNPIAQQALKLVGQANGYTQLGQLYTLQSTLGRMDLTLNQVAGVGDTARTLTKAGGDLFGLARDAYGDATKWAGIAEANNITDPQITGITNVKIPRQAPDNGGVLGSAG